MAAVHVRGCAFCANSLFSLVCPRLQVSDVSREPRGLAPPLACVARMALPPGLFILALMIPVGYLAPAD
jgi:hypothetical protein